MVKEDYIQRAKSYFEAGNCDQAIADCNSAIDISFNYNGFVDAEAFKLVQKIRNS